LNIVADNTPCFVLHIRPYRNTSVIADVFSHEFGRVGIVFRGVKASRKNPKSRLLQPFQPLTLSWRGKGELKSGRAIEVDGPAIFLTGKSLFSGLYLNELLTRLLFNDDPYPCLYADYVCCLKSLLNASELEAPLRLFEMKLLESLGYPLPLHCDALTGNAIDDDADYGYDPEVGFARQAMPQRQPAQPLFSGKLLTAMASENFSSQAVRRQAKQLMRTALAFHLGHKPLKSRHLFNNQYKD